MERQTTGPTERQCTRSNLPSDSSPHSNGHTLSPPALIALKLGRNVEHKWYDALTANRSVSSCGSPSISPKPL